MAEPKVITFNYQEIVTALVKDQNIHEGIWGIYLEFGLAAANVNAPGNEFALVPAAIVPVVKMGIQRFEKENSLTVDAAKVNPADPKSKS